MSEELTQAIVRLKEAVAVVETEIQHLATLLPSLDEGAREHAMEVIEALCAESAALRGQERALEEQ